MTSENTTGTIRSTLAAAPQRGTVLAAKATIFGAAAAVTRIASSVAGVLTGQAILASKGHRSAHRRLRSAPVGDRRRPPRAIAAADLVLLLPVLALDLPTSWQTAITRYLP
jgi:hypothetical protein